MAIASLNKQPQIADLAVISDRHTCALLDRNGTIHWYCPQKFDNDALISSLIDEEKGGFWSVSATGKECAGRQFQGRSSILNTYFTIQSKGFTITDFMPIASGINGICRLFSQAPFKIENTIRLKPAYGLGKEIFSMNGLNTVFLSKTWLWLTASHPLSIDGDTITFEIPENEAGWASLSDHPGVNADTINDLYVATKNKWVEIEKYVDYHGLYENEVRDSLRALQQMTYEPTGGIIAAATTSLPEVIGGTRNYDYRYVWIRDAALITNAVVQLKTTGKLEKEFLSFIAGAMKNNDENHASCFYTIDQKIKKDAKELALAGYRNSRPVQIGNTAAKQYQLDAESNILIAASLIYDKFGEKSNWEAIVKIADFICKNWDRPDNGIWEENQQQHYTSSKAFAARALELIATYQDNTHLREQWLRSAVLIRKFIDENCITIDGAYAVYAGSEEVDVTAALYVAWGYDKPDSETMLATIVRIEKEYCYNNLYRRRLEEFDSRKEGIFLAGSCWMAHYYNIAGDLKKSKKILEAVLGFKNDLGYFSEEGDPDSSTFLGNFPQTFVHSSFICAVQSYQNALAGIDSTIR